jgi:hypothetical protein
MSLASTACSARRLVAAALALALVAASVASVGHEIEERHEVCAEHGELIHVGSGWVEASPTDAIVEGDAGVEHGEHCLMAWVVQTSIDLSEAALQSPLPPASAGSSPALAAATGSELYRLAPKNSPPV